MLLAAFLVFLSQRESADPVAPPSETERIRMVARVVDEGVPVAGARVWFVPLSSAVAEVPMTELGDLLGHDLEPLCRRLGRELHTDGAGLARHELSDGALAIAEGLRGVGYAIFGLDEGHDYSTEEELTIELHPSPPLRVRVLDAERRPAANVPVALRHREGDEVSDWLRTRTDETGACTLPHLGLLLRGEPVPAGVFVSASILALAPIESPLARGPLPAEALELVLPATGSLEILLEDGSGAPLALEGVAELALVTEDASDPDLAWRRQFLPERRDDQRVHFFVRGGRALIEAIGLALALELTVDDLPGYQPVHVACDGPSRPGERAVVRVRVEDRTAILTGTLRSTDSGPAGPWSLSGNLWLEGHGRGLEVEADAEGRFSIPIDGDWPHQGRLTLSLRADYASGRHRQVRIERDIVLAPGENELGRLDFEPLPLLAAGRVVGPDGQVLGGARIRLAEWPEDFDADWVGEDLSDALGRFSLHAPSALERIELRVTCEGFVSRLALVEVGRADLELALARGGSIAGQVLVADEAALYALTVVARRDGRVEEASTLAEADFALSDLAPGTYDLALELEAEPEFECSVPGVVVAAGATTRDARLVIDLRQRLRTFEVTPVPREGELSIWTFVRRRPAGTATYRNAEDWSLDDLVLTTSHPALDLHVLAAGRRAVELLGVAEDRRIELQPALPIELVLVPPLALGEHEWLGVELESEVGLPLGRYRLGRFWDGETAEGEVPEPGTYRARLEFLQQAKGDLRATPLALATGATLHVADREGVQRFSVTLDAAGLTAIAVARASPPPR